MARMASERDGLLSDKERLQRELSFANAQLAVTQERMLSRKEHRKEQLGWERDYGHARQSRAETIYPKSQ